ncbi:MAG: DNA gyrase C-terminal beta-propeller domain-containing protein, partial [Planctomycetota bacterium]
YGKRTPLADYLVQSDDGSTRTQSRGGKGRIDIRTTTRNGPAVAVCCVADSDSLMFVSEKGMIVRMPAGSISQIGRNTQGVRVVNLKPGDRLMAAARVVESDEDGEGD